MYDSGHWSVDAGAEENRALADPVAIVHVPVNISQQHESRIYWSINNAHSLSEEFFNVTSNRIEVSDRQLRLIIC